LRKIPLKNKVLQRECHYKNIVNDLTVVHGNFTGKIIKERQSVTEESSFLIVCFHPSKQDRYYYGLLLAIAA